MEYAVIENAGYVGERLAKKGFGSYMGALKWMKRVYEEEERERLHVEIARREGEGWSYDL
jgi:hypothetical protein